MLSIIRVEDLALPLVGANLFATVHDDRADCLPPGRILHAHDLCAKLAPT